MTPQELIAIAYATEVSEEERQAQFSELIEETKRKYVDEDRRFAMTQEDLNRVFTM